MLRLFTNKGFAIVALAFGVGACSTPNANSSLQNYVPPDEISVNDNRITSLENHNDVLIGDTIDLPDGVSRSTKATVEDFYISASGEMCWELVDINSDIIIMCDNDGTFKFTRNILSHKL